jgi:hypothetical protein
VNEKEVWAALASIQEGLNKLYERLGPPPGWEPTSVSVAPAESPQGACEAYESWGGIVQECEECGRPAWEHAMRRGAPPDPFSDAKGDPEPWGGLMKHVRKQYLHGSTVEVATGADGVKRLRLSK